jgi:hypothetical protein
MTTTTRRSLRTSAIRYAMRQVKQGADWQQIQWDIANDPRFMRLVEGMTNDQADDYTMGIIRFCEHACGFSRW